MQLRVVLVEPVHDANVGSVARACANFGVGEIALVKPKAKLKLQARKYAKHAFHLLESAKRCKTVAEAVRGCDFIVGTTGVVGKFTKRTMKNCVSIGELRGKISEGDKVALLFGSETSGLDRKTLAKCDAVAVIPASKEYPVLNLSHAVAVALYALFEKPKVLYVPAPAQKVRQLEKMLGEAAAQLGSVHDKKKVSLAFSRVLKRARIADEEAQAMFAFFSGVLNLASRRKSRKALARPARK